MCHGNYQHLDKRARTQQQLHTELSHLPGFITCCVSSSQVSDTL